jgi:hypothetical protein
MKKSIGLPTLIALAPLMAIAQSLMVAENVPPPTFNQVDPGTPRDVIAPFELSGLQSDFDKRYQARLAKDASLKPYGKTTKIVNKKGVVVLQGQVMSADVSRRLEWVARDVAGKHQFRSELRTSAQAR